MMSRKTLTLENTLNEDDYFVTCEIEDRIISLAELQRFQKELSKIKGFFFEIHGAIVSKE